MRSLISLLLFVGCTGIIYSQQYYEGPWQGTAPAGVVVTTDTFMNYSGNRKIINPIKPEKGEKDDDEVYEKKQSYTGASLPIIPGTAVTRYQEDTPGKDLTENKQAGYLVKSFEGISSIYNNSNKRPDTYIAAGPGYFITVINSVFEIRDKNGSLIKSIDVHQWYNSSAIRPIDPKIIYDEFIKRWVMIWLDKEAINISISVDSIPTGKWVNRILPAALGPTQTNPDYEGLGYDKNAIYITPHMFTNTTYISLSAGIRIISNAQLLADPSVPISFTDFWSIRNPFNLQDTLWNLRPCRVHDDRSDYYLVDGIADIYSTLYLCRITNVATSPQLSWQAVQLNSFVRGKNGGNPIWINNYPLFNEPEFRNGTLTFVRQVANPYQPDYSAIRYVKINMNSMLPSEDIIFGSNINKYFYPALAVDGKGNSVICFSVMDSSFQNFSVGFTAKKNEDSLFAETRFLHSSEQPISSYLYSDYTGAWLDPENNTDIWIYAAFSKTAQNYGTWIGAIRVALLEGASLYPITYPRPFPAVPVGNSSDVQKVQFCYLGTNSILIDSVKTSSGNFRISSVASLPLALHGYDTLSINARFVPLSSGNQTDTIKIFSGGSVALNYPLNGYGFILTPADIRVIYGITPDNQLITLDKSSGSGIVVNSFNIDSVSCIAIQPKTRLIYGLTNKSNSGNQLLCLNKDGWVYALRDLQITGLSMIAFDTSGVLYAAKQTGEIYKINITGGNPVFVCTVKSSLNSLCFNPQNNNLSAAIYGLPIKDMIVNINLSTGDTIRIGRTGFNYFIYGLFSDELGALYGVINSSSVSKLIKIDPLTGHAVAVGGSTGLPMITGLAYYSSDFTGVSDQKTQVPHSIYLQQNYPNPFNPTTTISYYLPDRARVVLNIYNQLGEKVAMLQDGDKPAGIHNIEWKAVDLASGVYFCELKTDKYRVVRKLLLLK